MGESKKMRFCFALFLTVTTLITNMVLASDQNTHTDDSSTQKSEKPNDSGIKKPKEKTDSNPINTKTPTEKKSELGVSLFHAINKLIKLQL